MSTRHWVDIQVGDGEIEYTLTCGDPGACQETVEESRHLGCAVKDYWNDMGTDLLSATGDATGDPVPVGRFEVTCEWQGYGPDAELYLHPADGDSLDIALSIANEVIEQRLGAYPISAAQAVEKAVRALWAAGYRRFVPPEQPTQPVPPESAAIAERMSTFMAEAAAPRELDPTKPVPVLTPETMTVGDVEDHLFYQDLNDVTRPLWRHFLLHEVESGPLAERDGPRPHAAQLLSHPPKNVENCSTMLRADERVLRWVPLDARFIRRPAPDTAQRWELAYGFVEPVLPPFCPWCAREYVLKMQFLVVPRSEEFPEGYVKMGLGPAL